MFGRLSCGQLIDFPYFAHCSISTWCALGSFSPIHSHTCSKGNVKKPLQLHVQGIYDIGVDVITQAALIQYIHDIHSSRYLTRHKTIIECVIAVGS